MQTSSRKFSQIKKFHQEVIFDFLAARREQVDRHVARMEGQKYVAQVLDDNSADWHATNHGVRHIARTKLETGQVL